MIDEEKGKEEVVEEEDLNAESRVRWRRRRRRT